MEGDSAYNALDNGCYTSRTIYVLGKAIVDAGRKLLERLEVNAARCSAVSRRSWDTATECFSL